MSLISDKCNPAKLSQMVKQHTVKNTTKKNELEKIARLEIFLSELEDSLSVSMHKNVLVVDCIAKAEKTLKSSARSLSRGDLESCFNLSNIAWLHLSFGRELMVAEMLESEIGESDFLELTELASDLTISLEHEFEITRKLITQLLKLARG